MKGSAAPLGYEELVDAPDYRDILDHLGLSENDDPELVREAIEDEIAALEADADAEDAADGDA